MKTKYQGHYASEITVKRLKYMKQTLGSYKNINIKKENTGLT